MGEAVVGGGDRVVKGSALEIKGGCGVEGCEKECAGNIKQEWCHFHKLRGNRGACDIGVCCYPPSPPTRLQPRHMRV